MKTLRLLFLIYCIFFISNAYSQKRAVDSLEVLLKDAKHDTSRINIYLALSETQGNNNALKYAGNALNLIDKLLSQTASDIHRKTLLAYKAKAFESIAVHYVMSDQKNFQKAIEFAEKILKIRIEIGDKKGEQKVLSQMSQIHQVMGNYLKNLECLQKAVIVSEELKDMEDLADLYVGIGRLYFSQKDTNSAFLYFNRSLNIRKTLKDKKMYANALTRSAMMYEFKKDHKKAEEFINEGLSILYKEKDTVALYHNYEFIGRIYRDSKRYDKSIENYILGLELGSRDTSWVGTIYDLIGLVYSRKKEYKTALEYHKKAVKINERYKDGWNYEESLSLITNCYLNLNQYKEAHDYAVLSLSQEKKLGFGTRIVSAERTMARADSCIGKYKEAYEHYSNYINLRDKLNGEEFRKEAEKQKFKAAFDKEKEEARLEQQRKDIIVNEEKKNQRTILFSVIGGLLLVFTFSIFVLRNLRITRKQKYIIEEQKHLVEEKHKEITDSINYAERIQRSFLASEELLTNNLKEHFVFFQPKDIVSGDFYWASKVAGPGEAGNFALVTADSTGHGVPGAIMSILNISSLEKAVEQGVYDPSEILNHTRKTIIERLKKDGSKDGGKDGMDCSLISFDLKNNRLVYSAANNPVWIVRTKPGPANQSELIELAADKMPVGKHDRDSIPFKQHSVELQNGDMIYAITDGMPDQFGGPKGKKFMYKKLKELLVSISQLSMEEQKKNLGNSLNDWKGNSEQVDDVTIIGVRI